MIALSDVNIVSIRNLVKRYNKKIAVDQLDLDIRKGEIFGLLGPNGAGKTTTIRCISTLAEYDSGTITVDGYDLKTDADKAKRLMGVIQQQIALDKDLTIRENMNVHGMYHKLGKTEREQRISELSSYFGLDDYLDKPVDSLSGGWKKRASIVCAMLHQPKVLFLDEPTSGLDISARRLLWDVIRSLNSNGTTIVLTTHYIEEIEALCHRVGIVNHGRIIALDEPRSLCESLGKWAVEYNESGKTQYRYFKDRDEAKKLVTNITCTEEVILRRTNLEDVFMELTGDCVGGVKS